MAPGKERQVSRCNESKLGMGDILKKVTPLKAGRNFSNHCMSLKNSCISCILALWELLLKRERILLIKVLAGGTTFVNIHKLAY